MHNALSLLVVGDSLPLKNVNIYTSQKQVDAFIFKLSTIEKCTFITYDVVDDNSFSFKKFIIYYSLVIHYLLESTFSKVQYEYF